MQRRQKRKPWCGGELKRKKRQRDDLSICGAGTGGLFFATLPLNTTEGSPLYFSRTNGTRDLLAARGAGQIAITDRIQHTIGGSVVQHEKEAIPRDPHGLDGPRRSTDDNSACDQLTVDRQRR
jgi:hypothetical protein